MIEDENRIKLLAAGCRALKSKDLPIEEFIQFVITAFPEITDDKESDKIILKNGGTKDQQARLRKRVTSCRLVTLGVLINSTTEGEMRGANIFDFIIDTCHLEKEFNELIDSEV